MKQGEDVNVGMMQTQIRLFICITPKGDDDGHDAAAVQFMATQTRGPSGGILLWNLTWKVPDVPRKDPVRSREVLELARTMSKRDG